MTLKSNIIFEPATSIEVFLDSVQEVQSQQSREVITYQKSTEAVVNTVARYRFPLNNQYTAKFTTDIIENKRKLVYLAEYPSHVIVIDGGNSNAIYGHIGQLTQRNANLSACDIGFGVTAKGGVSGQFYDSDDCLSSGSQAGDSNAVGGFAELLNANGEKAYVLITQSDYELPAGDYKMFARVRDTAQVADDVKLEVYNATDVGSITSETFTVTSSYSYIIMDFTTDSSEDGDSIRFSCEKATTTANSIYVDFIGFVKV